MTHPLRMLLVVAVAAPAFLSLFIVMPVTFFLTSSRLKAIHGHAFTLLHRRIDASALNHIYAFVFVVLLAFSIAAVFTICAL